MSQGTLNEQITRSLAYMLRHQPEEFDLELDAHGYGDLGDVVCALNERLRGILVNCIRSVLLPGPGLTRTSCTEAAWGRPPAARARRQAGVGINPGKD